MNKRYRIDSLSDHVSYGDATRSEWAIRNGVDNAPDLDTLKRMIVTARRVYEPLWKASGGKIRINSFFRNPRVNKAIGGSKNSQHMSGEAMDLDAVAPLTNAELLKMALALPEYDQIIHEYGTDTEPAWVHVSFREGNNRKQFRRIK